MVACVCGWIAPDARTFPERSAPEVISGGAFCNETSLNCICEPRSDKLLWWCNNIAQRRRQSRGAAVVVILCQPVRCEYDFSTTSPSMLRRWRFVAHAQKLVLSPPALRPMPPPPLLPLLLLFLGAAAGSGAQMEELHQEQRAAAGSAPACTVYHPTDCWCELHFLVLVTVNLRTGCNLTSQRCARQRVLANPANASGDSINSVLYCPPLAMIAQAPDPASQV